MNRAILSYTVSHIVDVVAEMKRFKNQKSKKNRSEKKKLKSRVFPQKYKSFRNYGTRTIVVEVLYESSVEGNETVAIGEMLLFLNSFLCNRLV